MVESSMRGLSVELHRGRDAFVAQSRCFLGFAERLGDRDLLAASRCHGWAVLDLVVHVRAGLEEMLRGMTSPTSARPTVDAAGYWSAWDEAGDRDRAGDPELEVEQILWTRRTASAYRRPTVAVRHLRHAVDAITDAAALLSAPAVVFQGHVIRSGDFLATWAVELAIHQVDAGRELDVGVPDAAALALTRDTIGALLGSPVPPGVTDLDALLIGSGRTEAPDGDVRRVLG